MKTGVYVRRIEGNTIITDREKKININKEHKLGVNSVYEIETKENSYTYLTDKPSSASKRDGSYTLIFPDSKIKVFIGYGKINSVEILKGFVFTFIEKGLSKTELEIELEENKEE